MTNINSASGRRISVKPRHAHPGIIIRQGQSYVNVTADELPLLIEAMQDCLVESYPA